MTPLKKYLLGGLGLILLLLCSLYLVPMGRYLPEVEKQLSQKLHVPSKITALNLAPFPLPHLEVHGIELGGTGGIGIQTLSVTPNLFSLLSPQIQISEIKLSHVKLNYAVLQEILAAQQANAHQEKASVYLRVLRAEDVTVNMPGLSIPDVALKVTLKEDGNPEEIWLAQDKEHVTLTLQAQAPRRFSLHLTGKAWTLPIGPARTLDEINMTGVLTDHDLDSPDFYVRMDDAKVEGKLKLLFGRTWQLSGEISNLLLPLEQFGKKREKPIEMQGELTVKGTFSAQANSAAGLKEALRFNGELDGDSVQVRIASAATQLLQLEDLAAKVSVQNNHLQLNDFQAKMYSGTLQGKVDLALMEQNMHAELALAKIDLQPLVAALSNQILFSGSLDGKARVQLALGKMDTFPQQANIQGDFLLQKGVLSKVNLAQAAQITATAPADAPSTTEFEAFSGNAQIDATGYHFRQLELSSGVLRAQGEVDMALDKQLSGSIEVALKNTLGMVNVPLVLSGTLDQPGVAPSAGFVAGAAVGTAVLPGVGTVVGMKVGGLLHKLFDGGKAQSAVPAQ